VEFCGTGQRSNIENGIMQSPECVIQQPDQREHERHVHRELQHPGQRLQATTRLLFPEFSRGRLYQVPVAFSGLP
jgi:hypothetical protein